MKIEKAIELLDIAKGGFPSGDAAEDYYVALALSIEALKRVQYCRSWHVEEPFALLPGETEGD